MRIRDHSGRKIGILTILYKTGKLRYNNKSAMYRCKCDCGNYKDLSTAEFSSAKSCGCLRKKNKEKFKTMNVNMIPNWILPPGESSRNALYNRYLNSSKKRKYEFLLTIQEFESLTKKNCHYCKCVPNQICHNKKRKNTEYVYNGIDRIDNTKGYNLSNCITCCKKCNRAKDIMSKEEFITWIKTIYSNIENI